MTDGSKVRGIHAVAAVLRDDPARVRVVYCQTGRVDARIRRVLEDAGAAGVRVERVDRRQLDRLAGPGHQGIAAHCHELAMADERAFADHLDALPRPWLLLALDGVTDPRNLGACLRSATGSRPSRVIPNW